MLPKVAPALGRIAPKIVVGYSDASALLGWLTSRHGWVTFHGPMVASDLPELGAADARSLVRTLRGDPPPALRVRGVLHTGSGEGRLVGGCLSVVVALLGTPYALDLRGAVLFLEDVAEPPYRLDRMLTQLLQSGALRGVRAVVFGEMARCGTPGAVKRVLAEQTASLRVPVLFGAPSGHGRGKRTLPFGIRVRVDGTRRTVEFLERCTAT
ncbi:MAG: muramoyltetrapeptide carboxypeptidase [Candidatus Binatota bacterium]|nr:muramoyltetrapeptide carboxypeptidase [Candidatus Binatota bacterium]